MEDAKGEPVGLTMGFQAGGLIGLYLGFSLATISVLTDAENIQRTVSWQPIIFIRITYNITIYLRSFKYIINLIILEPILAKIRELIMLNSIIAMYESSIIVLL